MNEAAFIIVLIVAALVIGVIVSAPLRSRRRRRAAASAPFPPHWERILQTRMPVGRGMPGELRSRWYRAIKIFISEKRFVGCGGLDISDEMRVLIAAQACLLVLGRDGEAYPDVKWILVYPGAFRVTREHVDETGVETIEETILAGESWDTGRVIVSWQDFQDGLHYADGDNVVLHEFAHQLDQESGDVNGAPVLEGATSYAAWAEVLGEEYSNLQARAARGDPGVLDDYGASDPGEFFAVATEAFFETPNDMLLSHPALYRELRGYYRVDPASWR